MKNTVGHLVGLLLGIAGTGIGLYSAWRGFSANSFTSGDLGFFCASMAALIGCLFAIQGAIAGYWLRHYGSARLGGVA